MTQRPFFLFTALCFICSNTALFSQTDEPSVAISPMLMNQLAGVGAGSKSKGILTCSALLKKTWGYPNAQVTPFCYDAETACMRYDLLKQEAHKDQGRQMKNLKEIIPFSHADASMKLYGCKVALEAVMAGNSINLPPVGSYTSPFLNLIAPTTQGQ